MQEHDCRLFFEVLRWGLETKSLESSRPLQKLLNQVGAEELSLQWHRCRMGKIDPEILLRSISIGQIESKLWLVDALRGVLPERAYNVCIVGGWVGWLARLLLWRCPHLIRRLVILDSDPEALRIARLLHSDLIQEGRLQLIEGDANKFQFGYDFHVIINTSCEHFTERGWYESLPEGRILAMQSTNEHWDDDHSHCVDSVFDLRKQYPVDTALYMGQLKLINGWRFLCIGRK